MDYVAIFKTFDDVVKNLSPEFKEKYFRKIAGTIIVLVAIPATAEFAKHCVDKAAYCYCFKAAAENGQLPADALNTFEPTLIEQSKTA